MLFELFSSLGVKMKFIVMMKHLESQIRWPASNKTIWLVFIGNYIKVMKPIQKIYEKKLPPENK